ncbi:MAG: response regulator [Candidatus Micrarchaeota archaeon]
MQLNRVITPTGTPRPDALDLSKGKAAPEGAAEMAMRKGRAIILLVDDMAVNIFLLSKTLGADDRYFLKSSDGAQALDVLRSVRVSLVISDLRMPNMTGLGLLREAKKLQPGAGFILMSGGFTPEVRKEALDLGADALIERPYDTPQLQKVVAEVIAKHPLEDPPPAELSINMP